MVLHRRCGLFVGFSSGWPFSCSSPALAGRAAAGTELYVSAEESGEIVVVDAERGVVVARVPVGKRPRGVKLSHDGKLLYVALSGSPRAAPGVDESKLPPPDRAADGVGVVDLAARKLVRTYASGQDPESFDLSRDGKTLYVSNEDASELSVLDLAAGKVTAQDRGRRRARGRHAASRRQDRLRDVRAGQPGRRRRHEEAGRRRAHPDRPAAARHRLLARRQDRVRHQRERRRRHGVRRGQEQAAPARSRSNRSPRRRWARDRWARRCRPTASSSTSRTAAANRSRSSTSRAARSPA